MKYILFGIILLFTFGCDDYPSSGLVNPTFDPPVVNEMLIMLENAQAAGILKFGPVLVPIIEDEPDNTMFVYPSIATDHISIAFSNKKTVSIVIYLVRANVSSNLSNNLFIGSNIGKSNSEFTYDLNFSTYASENNSYAIDLRGLSDGVYVAYIRDNYSGLILGETAFFKTNEANKQRIYKNLNIGNYR